MSLIRKIIYALKAKSRMYRRVVQRHHITYEPIEWIVFVYKGEHWILTQLQRRTHVSKGFVTSLKEWLKEHELRAISLGKEIKRPAKQKREKKIR